MRTILIAMVAAAGIGLLGTSGPAAMPRSGLSTQDTAAVTDQAIKTGWHTRWRSHWRWGSRGGRCHARYRSWWYPC